MSLDKLLSQPDSRPRFTFKVPEKDRTRPDDPTSVTMVEVRVQDENECMKISDVSGSGMVGYLVEITKRSVVAVNGKPVDWGSPSSSDWYERCGPKVRALIKRGYNKIHTPSEEGAEDFLASMEVEGG